MDQHSDFCNLEYLVFQDVLWVLEVPANPAGPAQICSCRPPEAQEEQTLRLLLLPPLQSNSWGRSHSWKSVALAEQEVTSSSTHLHLQEDPEDHGRLYLPEHKQGVSIRTRAS